MVITMKNSKFLRSALMLVLALVIIGSVTGGTIAWFTDNVEATNNVIQSGTLDIDIQLKDGDKWISLEKNPATKVFDYNLWEPGYTQYETLTIVNQGNLALEYILNVIPGEDQVLAVTGESLAEVIDVYMAFGEKEPASFAEIAAYKTAPDYQNGWWYCGTLSEMIADEKGFTQGYMLPSGKTDAPDGVLEVGLMQGSCTCTVALHMQEEADNRYQNLSLGNLGFKLMAKQYTYEEDSFDHLYDKDAEYGEGSVIGDKPEAIVRELTTEELTVNFVDEVDGIDVSTVVKDLVVVEPGEKTLDFGLAFTPTEDVIAGLEDIDYSQWYVDFELASSKELVNDGNNHLTLAGHYKYGDLGTNWLGFETTGVAIPADTFIRIVKRWDPQLTYEEVSNIPVFKCGVIVDKAYFADETLTLRLCMYNPVTGEPFVLKEITKTF
ncbi:MAG: hypothetical protein E7326_05405 [Clostridiales bacterium]|nr:hypothetical protein [Clostridiales bacterium]